MTIKLTDGSTCEAIKTYTWPAAPEPRHYRHWAEAGEELDAKAKAYAEAHDVSYDRALDAIMADPRNDDLVRDYNQRS